MSGPLERKQGSVLRKPYKASKTNRITATERMKDTKKLRNHISKGAPALLIGDLHKYVQLKFPPHTMVVFAYTVCAPPPRLASSTMEHQWSAFETSGGDYLVAPRNIDFRERAVEVPFFAYFFGTSIWCICFAKLGHTYPKGRRVRKV